MRKEGYICDACGVDILINEGRIDHELCGREEYILILNKCYKTQKRPSDLCLNCVLGIIKAAFSLQDIK